MLIPTTSKIYSQSPEPLVTSQIGDDPFVVQEIGVWVSTIGAVVAILGLQETRTNSHATIPQVDDFGKTHLIGELRQHARRSGSIFREGFKPTRGTSPIYHRFAIYRGGRKPKKKRFDLKLIPEWQRNASTSK